jgi:hypothetical protein
MKEKASVAKERIDTEELLDFDLDEESSLDLDSFDEDEEVIELVDLVEEGEAMGLGEKEAEAAPKEGEIDFGGLDFQLESLGDVRKSSAMEESEAGEELDLSDLTIEFGGEEELRKKISELPEEGEITESDLEGLLAEKEETLPIESGKAEEAAGGAEVEITEADLEGMLEEAFEKEPVEASLRAEEISSSEEGSTELEDALKFEELSEPAQAVDLEEAQPDVEKASESAVEEQILETPSTASEPALQGIAGLSEERLEMIISRVVENVVERVARETMTNVAERLITEAIDALKRSMEVSDSQ